MKISGVPYGAWTTPGGTVILFNRNYKAMWWRTPTGEIFEMETVWARPRVSQERWFWPSERFSPKRCTETRNKIVRAKRAFLAGKPLDHLLA
jgi:hypothetical protein